MNEQLSPVADAIPEQAICREALLEKYAKDNEQTMADVRARVARALAAAEVQDKRAYWERRFYEAMQAGFIPAGRINSAAGIPMHATLINCFVQPVGDSISDEVDGKPGIYTALRDAGETMRRGGDVGYNFTISVGVTEALMQAVENDAEIGLVHKARPHPDAVAAGVHQREAGLWVYAKPRARELWDQIMKSTYDHAEPGILFIDRMNQDNNLNYCEAIAATNPCAEQPLPAYGCCCLGSINLTRFVDRAFSEKAAFDYERFGTVVEVSIRMLDNVLDVTAWPLKAQHEEAMAKRRVGLGFTGLGDALIMLRLRYDSEEARATAAKISEFMRDAAYKASTELAKERGAFPLFNADLYLSGSSFAARLPAELKAQIRKNGIRNSHLLSIAPTGTISLAFADNASNGIEPPFSWTYTRKTRMADGTLKEFPVEDCAWRLYKHGRGDVSALPPYFVTALELSASAHEQMVAAVAPYVDTSISKTVNVPETCPYDDFQD